MSRYAELILGLINQSNKHMTAEQIFLELKKTEPKVVQATVYNNLNALCQDHLVCRKCGALSDMTFDSLTENLEKQLGAPILSYDLKVFYLCPKCRER